jgi:hypothetical protein
MLENTEEIAMVTDSIPHHHAFVRGSHASVKSVFKAARPLRKFLADAKAEELTPSNRALLVDQAIMFLDGFYVHLPLKRAMYAVDPLQRLRLLRRRLWKIESDLDFHAEMIDIFSALHDLHTGYLLPTPFRDATAVLPFKVEAFYEDGTRKYLVSNVRLGFKHPTFRPGAEVVLWNGVPIARAVKMAGTHSPGSNSAAQHENGLARLTMRVLANMPPPDEEWVTIGYRTPSGRGHEIRFDWMVIGHTAGLTIDSRSMSLEGDRVRQVGKLMYAPHIVTERTRLAKKTRGNKRQRLKQRTDSLMPDIFEAHNVETPDGEVGYIRIRSFNADHDDFVAEFERLLVLLSPNGLIIDVRDNPGGHIGAGERLLQLLGGTPPPIEPQRLFLISTPLTLRLCRQKLQRSNPAFGPKGLEPWRKSLVRAAETGAQFSASFPYTNPEQCNALGRKYDGPVVVVTNARSYSATEFFAAGIQDHGIGLILGTADRTGGGGANVRMHEELMESFADDAKSPFKELPKQSGFTVAFRRSQRVRERAGSEVEDFGVASDKIHHMTRKDLLQHNIDLIDYAAKLLAGKRKRSHVGRGKGRGSKKAVKTGAGRSERLPAVNSWHCATRRSGRRPGRFVKNT